MTVSADAAAIARRLAELKSKRSNHETTWQDCFDHTFPLRGSGLQQSVLDAQSAAERKARLLTAVGTECARTLAAALMSGGTPANSRWVAFEVPDASDGASRQWLDEAAGLLWQNIHASNYDAAGFEACEDIVAAGWFVLFVDEDRKRGGLSFEVWPLSQCYCASTRDGGPIDVVFREYTLTAEQAVEQFGDDVSEQTQKLAREKPDQVVEFVRAIYPREVYAEDARLAKNLPIACCDVETKARKLVRESGFHEMPAIVPRWNVIPGSAYAVGPTFDALPDLRCLNEIKRMELAAMDLAIAGMWIAQDDGVLNPRTVKVGPRKVIVANSVDSMKELKSGADFQVAFTEEERLTAAIRKVFMADQLQPADGPAMTATEVHARVQLIRQMLGPVYARWQSEFLQPLIERCFGLAYRAGVFADAPESIAGLPMTVKFLSPLARAQSLEEVSAMDQFETVLLNESEVNPEILDNYDWDEATRERGRMLGVPAKLLRDADAVKEMREARADAARQAQEDELTAGAVATAAPKMIERAVA